MITATETCDLLLTGGHVIDPRNGIDERRDIAIRDGCIAAVGENLTRDGAREVRDVSGLTVTPGLIDIHTHIYHKATFYGVDPDPIAARSVIATLVDAGSAGAGNFDGLRDFIFVRSPFRLLAYLNISYPGIFAFDRDFVVGEAAIRELLSVDRCVEVAEQNRDIIVGVKVRLGANTSGTIGLEALDRAIAAAEKLGLPVMSHIGKPPPTYAEILARLRPGDILTHCYRPAPNSPVDDHGNVLPALIEARQRGVLFDIGHGMGAFGFESAEVALAQGFAPDIISSDVHALSVNGPAYDLLHTMSKLINRGVMMQDAVRMATVAPARALRREDLGHLSVGAVADVSLIERVEADFPFVDVVGKTRTGTSLLRPRGLLLAGKSMPVQPRSWEALHYRKKEALS
jgi:dihydroorotase